MRNWFRKGSRKSAAPADKPAILFRPKPVSESGEIQLEMRPEFPLQGRETLDYLHSVAGRSVGETYHAWKILAASSLQSCLVWSVLNSQHSSVDQLDGLHQ